MSSFTIQYLHKILVEMSSSGMKKEGKIKKQHDLYVFLTTQGLKFHKS